MKIKKTISELKIPPTYERASTNVKKFRFMTTSVSDVLKLNP